MPSSEAPRGERLQRFLARAGVASRRCAEELIRAGRVTVNGAVVRALGTRVDPDRDEVRVDGRPVRPQRLVYILLHKPAGVVSTVRDPQGRKTVLDLVPDLGVRLFPVGRLDYDSTGLLLLTNDGELAHRLTHPRFGAEKVYRVRVEGHPDEAELARLRSGVRLAEGVTAPARVRVLGHDREGTWLEVALREGRNRQVRRMLAVLGYRVRALARVREGPLRLGALPPGAWRHLTAAEVRRLRDTYLPPPRAD